MRKLTLFLLLVFVTSLTLSQDKPVTTFILVRHAEKDLTQSTNDPDLAPEGEERAAKLVEMLKRTDIQAIYSTDYKRTRQTVEPLATALSLTIKLYKPQVNADYDAMLQNHAGGTVVVSGHSNTIPQLINYLVGEDKYRPMEDGEYGNIIVVSCTERGKNAKVVWIKY